MEGASLKMFRPLCAVLFLVIAWTPAIPVMSMGAGNHATTEAVPIQAKLSESENIRFLKDGILELAAKLPLGAVIVIPRDTPPGNYKYRDQQGTVHFSSNFFYGDIRILSVEPKDAGDFPPSRIEALNSMAGGLFVSSAVVDDFDEGAVPPLKPSSPSAEFLKTFTSEGQPRFNYSQIFKARFGERLNMVVRASEMARGERLKWDAIYQELKQVGNRTEVMESSLLFEPVAQARRDSELYEEKGIVQRGGAWSIAVKGTAPRHGFPNVPCAEFQSEIVRQAYLRAGFDHREDFNVKKGNVLIWSSTAAVVNLATALFKAGWIPWEAVKFKPLVGAIVMHAKATSPGHTYMSAGESGRFVMDNGSPRGRDLRATSDRIISLMYRSGVFFLPPGIIPQPW